MRRFLATYALLVLTLPAISAQSGPCTPEWVGGFGGAPGLDGTVGAMVAFHDGSGPALYAAGDFHTAGGIAVDSLASWDGASWSPVPGAPSDIRALAVFDDGTGPVLIATGQAPGVPQFYFYVKSFDGVTWVDLGLPFNGATRVLHVHDDGTGPALYVGGDFTGQGSGGIVASRVARWDGAAWSALGGGVDDEVTDLQSFDDGGGPALYAAGYFTTAGGAPAHSLARWDGAAWSALGTDPQASVRVLSAWDDGGGPALLVDGFAGSIGGSFTTGLARWDGAAWSSLGSGQPAGLVYAMMPFDDGGGSALFVGGNVGGFGSEVPFLARWDGTSWSAVGSGFGAGSFAGVYALAEVDDGAGPALFAGGKFSTASGITVGNVARWDGASWSPLGGGLDRAVYAARVFDDGTGPELYVTGIFDGAGGTALGRIARWDGAGWSPLGAGLENNPGDPGTGYALLAHDDGRGTALFAAGSFWLAGGLNVGHVARWNGSAWSALGGGLAGTGAKAWALAEHDDGSGSALYAAGDFTTAGGQPASRVARWDGAAWSALGLGLNGRGHALAEFDSGSGPALFATGSFSQAGGASASRVARWDGTAWSPLGAGLNGTGYALAVFDDGGGPALFVGGSFTSAGGVPADHVARWDGTAWSSLGLGVDARVSSLSVFDDGAGAVLVAGGDFTMAGGAAASGLARWDGAGWSPIGAGVDGSVAAVLGLPAWLGSGGAPELVVGGPFQGSPAGDSHVARYRACSAFAPEPGCAPHAATLTALSPALAIGQPLDVVMHGALESSGTAALFLGFAGVDPFGCGLVVPGIGELLLALTPKPVLLAVHATTGGSAPFSLTFPGNPALVGFDVGLQVANLATAVEMSSAVTATIAP